MTTPKLVADNEAFDSLVAQAIDGIHDDDSASERVQVAATRCLLNDPVHPPPPPTCLAPSTPNLLGSMSSLASSMPALLP